MHAKRNLSKSANQTSHSLRVTTHSKIQFSSSVYTGFSKTRSAKYCCNSSSSFDSVKNTHETTLYFVNFGILTEYSFSLKGALGGTKHLRN